VLRKHLFRIIVAIAIGALLIGFNLEFVVDTILFAPSKPDFITFRFLNQLSEWMGTDTHISMPEKFPIQVRKMFEQINVAMSVSLIGGVVVAFPYIVYELWKFIEPALTSKEKKKSLFFIFSISFFFLLGISVGYFLITPLSIHFGYFFKISDQPITLIDLSDYIDLVVNTCVAMGVVFLFPVVAYFLTSIGILTPEFLATYRKHAIVAIMIVAAIITPPDATSMVIASIPLIGLYELKVLISPGSRNAPLSIQFSNHPKFTVYTIVDERSAGFVGVGMSQVTKKPTVLCCTSGSAAVNYYPAIVEAFYQNVPLLVLTADRPKEYVDSFDGQTIRQKEVFEKHSYGNFELSEEESDAANLENYLTIKKALTCAIENSGPVHINIPFSEPLYETTDEIQVQIDEFKFPPKKEEEISMEKLLPIANQSKKIMVVVGMQEVNPALKQELIQFAQNQNVTVLTESISNLNHPDFLPSIDPLIFNFKEDRNEAFAPDLLLTLGQNTVSKKIKSFLRNSKPKNHWHIDPFWQPDTYFCLTEKIKTTPERFLSQLNASFSPSPSDYKEKWQTLQHKKEEIHQNFMENLPFSDLKIFSILEEMLPDDITIHFANSTPIRYAQLFDFTRGNKKVYSNRGASGIDGSTSTSVGYAMISDTPTLLIT
ncbi:unnamed protein product, partial [Darwinula stevensoni]